MSIINSLCSYIIITDSDSVSSKLPHSPHPLAICNLFPVANMRQKAAFRDWHPVCSDTAGFTCANLKAFTI